MPLVEENSCHDLFAAPYTVFTWRQAFEIHGTDMQIKDVNCFDILKGFIF